MIVKLISTYNIYKNQGTFPNDFERFKPKTPPPYLEIADISNIKQDNLFNNQTLYFRICIKFIYYNCVHFILSSCSIMKCEKIVQLTQVYFNKKNSVNE